MLKNKSKLIVILMAIILMFSYTFCYAENEEVTNSQIEPRTTDEVMPISEDESTTQNQAAPTDEQSTSDSDKIESKDVYLFEDNIVVDYIVDGNLFAIGENVTIKSQIGGDAFIMANTINIDGGSIYSNLFAMANDITINGVVYDLYGMGDNITISSNAYVYRDLHTTSNSLNIFGIVGRNAYTEFDSISFTENDSEDAKKGTIYGNLEYTSSSEVDISTYVSGEVKYTKQVEFSPNLSIKDYILDALTSIVFALIIWLVFKWLAPKFVTGSKELLTTKFFPVIGLGILGLIVVPVISIILFILNVTATAGLLLLAIYILLLAISTAISTISLAEFVSNKLKKESNFVVELAMIIISSIVIYLVKLIPYVGGFLSFAIVVIGLGIIIKSILPIKNKETKVVEE